MLTVTLQFGFILLAAATFVFCVVIIAIVITCVIGFTVTDVVALSRSFPTNICCFVSFVAGIRVNGPFIILVRVLTVVGMGIISATGGGVLRM